MFLMRSAAKIKKIAREKNVHVKYIGFEIDDEFVLGYGLDYDGLGRNLKEIRKAVRKRPVGNS